VDFTENPVAADAALQARIEQARRATLRWLDSMQHPGAARGVSRISAAHDTAAWPGVLLPGTYNAVLARALLGDLAAARRHGQPVMGVHLCMAARQRVHAREVDDGHDTAVLQVDRVLEVVMPHRGQAAEQRQRWPVLQRDAHQVGEKDAVATRGLQHLVAQRVEQSGLAVDAALVEEDTGQHQRLGVGLIGPAPKVIGPAPARLAPGVGPRHHLARAVDVAAGVQAVVDEARQGLEVGAVHDRVEAVVDDKAVVLVAPCGLLAARLRARGDPGVVHRRWAQGLLGQREEARSDGVGDGGDDTARGVGAGVRGGECALQLAHPRRGLRQTRHVRLLEDLARQVHSRGRVALHHVGGRHHADHALPVQHRYVVDVVPRHHHQGFEGGLGHVHRQGRDRGDL